MWGVSIHREYTKFQRIFWCCWFGLVWFGGFLHSCSYFREMHMHAKK